MADQLYLSCWIRGFTAQNALAYFQKALTRFPFSRLAPVASVRVYAIEYVEPPALEKRFEDELEVSELVAAAREFQNPDCAYQVETCWDLMQQGGDGDWQLQPARVALLCFAPEFDNELGDNIRVEFGIDGPFVPDPGGNLLAVRANIRSLLHLTSDLTAALPVQRVTIWSDSEDNLADKLAAALEGEA
ncbi:MAG: hypothetical protein FJW39_02345 [Acidobacteria bacterium]|nr:hypothetical protein [Acidobacteriota bacterium]